MTTLYDNKVGGICGNDDCGQMSAWYVLSALGFYPVNPASGVYVLGSPLVDRATIHLDPNHQGRHVHDHRQPQFAAEHVHSVGHAQWQAPDAVLVQPCRTGGRRRIGFGDGARIRAPGENVPRIVRLHRHTQDRPLLTSSESHRAN